MVADPLAGFIADREALIAAAEPGTHAARALADLTDGAVSALAGAAASRLRVPFALFALGGYGAGRLLPHSDIDLLLISAGDPKDLEPLVREVMYPLWDADLTVGHQVRSIKDHVRAVREDMQNLTAFCTARFVCGDRALAERALAETFRCLVRDAARTRREIAARARPGSPYLLEPDLKEGAGGQRDLDELVWYAALANGAPARNPLDLLGPRLVEPDRCDALIRAQDVLTAARWRLHAAAGRARNVMPVEDAEVVGVDADAVQTALEDVHHTLLSVRGQLAGSPPHDLMPLTLDGLRAAAERGPDSLPGLERAARRGRLEHLAPGFGELMTLRRPALTHRYTVGAHCLRTLALLGRPQPDGPPVPLGDEHADALVIAALSHDLGKRQPGPGHAGRGQRDARAIAARLGLPEPVGEAAATLVREHLLLAEVATRSDTTDEDVVLTAAARLGDGGLVRPLFLLTAADMQATGPDVWTPWRAALVGDLAAKMEAALSPHVNGCGIVAAAERTRAEAIRRASSVGSSRSVLSFLESAPLRYLAHRSADEVLEDARLVQSLAGPGRIGEFASGRRPGAAPETWLLHVVTRDRPGLFATVAGVLALSGIDVLAAEAYTTSSGIALDTFTVASATRAPLDDGRWGLFERRLGETLNGTLDLEARLAEHRRHYDRTRTGGPTPRITIDGPMTFSTAVRVRTADRVGLLHDLAHAFEGAGLDIRRAVITTQAATADDVFEVTDAEGAPPQADTLHDTLVPLLEAVLRAT